MTEWLLGALARQELVDQLTDGGNMNIQWAKVKLSVLLVLSLTIYAMSGGIATPTAVACAACVQLGAPVENHGWGCIESPTAGSGCIASLEGCELPACDLQ